MHMELDTFITKLEESTTIEAYDEIIAEGVEDLIRSNLKDIAQEVKIISEIPKNRFSKNAMLENMEMAKKNVLQYLEQQQCSNGFFSEAEARYIVKKILNRFPIYCQHLYADTIHGKCSDTLKKLPGIKIENEYDLQYLIYPLLLAVFEDARTEEVQDTGHHSVRKDIVIPSHDIVIELKCTRDTMSEHRLSEEIASDMVHYENKNQFFYIYDSKKIISNVYNFCHTYEQKSINDKKIEVVVFQSLDI